MSSLRSALVLLGVVSATAAWTPGAAQDHQQLLEAGRRIYEEGVLPSGDTVIAGRANGLSAKGRHAACIGCHQRSGFGQFEGGNFVPPITGPALFSRDRLPPEEPRTAVSIRSQRLPHLARPAYDDTSLAQAIRAGIRVGTDVPLSNLMPRYALNDGDMRALTAYLRTLSSANSPGHDESGMQIATIIAPGQSPERRKAVIDVLSGCLADREPVARPRDAWTLQVWDLEGAPSTWATQLESKYNSKPPFVVLSGLGGAQWVPVHEFCNKNRLPCLFPNVDVPGGLTEGGTTFYFSKGVALEAEALARHLQEFERLSSGRVVQLRGRDPAAGSAADAFTRAMSKSGIAPETRAFDGDAAAALKGLGKEDTLVLWLQPDEVRSLSSQRHPSSKTFASGWLGGFEDIPLSPRWKVPTIVVLPIDAPTRRALRVRYNLEPWLEKHGMKVSDPILQGNTLAACKVFAETISRMQGHFVREYLVERVENYPAGMGNAPAPQAYPRFVISPGQRVTSRGVYLARFKKQNPREMELARDWFVP